MKPFIFILLLAFTSILNAQFFNYGNDGVTFPQLSDDIDPEQKIGLVDANFIYNDEVMKNASLKREYYENGELDDKSIVQLSDKEVYGSMEEFYDIINNSPIYLASKKQFENTTKTDSLKYEPRKNETIYISGKEHLLGYQDDSNADLHAIYFSWNDKVIGKRSIKEFTRAEYNQKNQMVGNFTYRGIEMISDDIDDSVIEFYADPTEYIHTEYDKMNRIEKQWISLDESWISGESTSKNYDTSYFTYFVEYTYNDKNQVISSKNTSYRLLPDWKNRKGAIKNNSITGDSHPDPKRLDRHAYSKEENTIHYTYNEQDKITDVVESVVEWKREGKSLKKSLEYEHRKESFTYNDDKIIAEYYQYDPEGVEWRNGKKDTFIKNIFYLDKNAQLVKKERFYKSDRNKPYLIVERATLEFEYK